jgi:hypothetical protein
MREFRNASAVSLHVSTGYKSVKTYNQKSMPRIINVTAENQEWRLSDLSPPPPPTKPRGPPRSILFSESSCPGRAVS